MLQDLKNHGIRTYEFPECDQDEDEEFRRRDAEMKVRGIHARIIFNSISDSNLVTVEICYKYYVRCDEEC